LTTDKVSEIIKMCLFWTTALAYVRHYVTPPAPSVELVHTCTVYCIILA